MEPTNEDRAEWAAEAVRAFAAQTGQDRSGDLKHDTESVVGDLLCDLLHYCNRDGIDFERALRNGRGHYHEEIGSYSSEGRSQGTTA